MRGKPRPKRDAAIPLGPPKSPRSSVWNDLPLEDIVIGLIELKVRRYDKT
jgi:hypothetical protein